MVQRVSTVAFEGIEARAVDVQVQIVPGLPAFAIVGLPDKAVSEARDARRTALGRAERSARLEAERFDLTEELTAPRRGHSHLVTQAWQRLETMRCGMC